MSEEIQQATQIIRVAYDGIEIAVKLGAGGLSLLKKALDFLFALLEREKSMGKTGMRQLLMKGGDLQVFQFDSGDLNTVKKMAKKYGILYSVLPDINKGDGKSEIIFHSEAVPRINMLIQKLNKGRITSIDDYLKNGDEQELEKLLSFLKDGGDRQVGKSAPGEVVREPDSRSNPDGLFERAGAYAIESGNISTEVLQEKFHIDRRQAEQILSQLVKTGILSGENGKYTVVMDGEAFKERVNGYYQLVDRIQAIPAERYENRMDITISRNLIWEEHDHAVKTRIPGTWGKQACYLWTDKKDCVDAHDGKTILTHLDREKEYKIYTADNRVIKTMKGEQLYDDHYDAVALEVRKQYQRASHPAAIRPKASVSVKR